MSDAALAFRPSVPRLAVYFLAMATLIAYVTAGRLPDLFEVMISSDNNYAFLLIFIGAYVLWQRRHAIRQRSRGASWFGVGLVAIGLVTFYLANAGHFIKLSYVPLVFFLFGVIIAWIGRGALVLFIAPFLIFLLAMPLSDYVTIQVSTALQRVSSTIGAEMLHAMGIAVFQNGNIIDLGVYQLQVAEACSGLRYLIPLTFTGFCMVWLARTPLWVKAVTIGCVVPITIFMNSLRIALTGVLVETRGIEAAEGFMHLFEGWVVFVAATILLVGVLLALTWIARRRVVFDDVLDFDRIEGRRLVAAGSGPQTVELAGISTAMLAALGLVAAYAVVAPRLDTREWVIPEREAFWSFPLAFDGYVGVPKLVGPDILEKLKATDHLLVDYVTPDEKTVNLWVAYNAVQQDGRLLHSPKVCLPGSGWEYERLDRRTIEVVGADSGRPFGVTEAVAVLGDARIAMVYWMEARGRQLGSETWNKVYVFYDSVLQRRADGALVRVLTAVDRGETDEEAFERVYDFIDTTYVHLAPYVNPPVL